MVCLTLKEHEPTNPDFINEADVKTTAIARAKINLNLHVTGRRKDGYHQLQSLVVFAHIGDEISLQKIRGHHITGEDQLSIDGPFGAGLSPDRDNLILGALRSFRSKWPDALPQYFSVSLIKNLPVASGIGGGSADGAAVLNLLRQRAKVSIDQNELAQLALELGADVPVCLANRAMMMCGIGQKLEPVEKLPEVFAVLINPGIGVSTSQVFSELKVKANPAMPPVPPRFAGVDDLTGWLKTTRNDLYLPAKKLVPEIGELVEEMSRVGDCLLARMSGSGATVFGLFSSKEKANRAAQHLAKKWPRYWCVATKISDGMRP